MSGKQVNRAEIRRAVREYILTEFLPGEDPSILTDETALVSEGVLDSIANARMVAFLESRYDILFKPHEVTQDRLDTVTRIVDSVERKVNE
jgi:acyl carrier protein